MTVLVLHHRGSLAATPYDTWLADYDGEVLLLASREYLDLVGEDLPTADHGYRHAEAVHDYEVSGRVEARSLDLAREYGVRHVIACQERDLERAAQLRDILGLPGQRLDSVIPFRDKVLMKELVRAAGLETAEQQAVECAADILSFADEHGFPLVLKPRDSASSVGLSIIGSRVELDAYLTDEFDLYGPHQPNLMAESFVAGPMCHVDGLVVDGRLVMAWPSQYQYTLSSFREDTGGRLDLTLDVDDPVTGRLIEFTERVLEALPGPRDFTFHAEVFHTPDDRLVLCEIACRTGGAAVRDIIRTLFGVDPSECWVRAQLGLPLPAVLGTERLKPTRMAGQLVLMKRPGRVVAIPEEAPPFPWLEKFRVFVRPGQVMEAASFSGDFMVTAIVSGPDRAACGTRLRQVESWFLGELVLEDTSAQVTAGCSPRIHDPELRVAGSSPAR